MSSPLNDLVRYVLLSGLSTATGLGVLGLLRVRLPQGTALLAAPAVTSATWAVTLGCGVSLGVPVRILSGPVWAASVGLAVYALVSQRQSPWKKPAWLLLAAALPIAVLRPYFVFGLSDYPGSPFPDGWSYAAFGQYLWEYSAGREGGLAPLHQYAQHLSYVRHVAASLLGFFSPLFTSGDTQAASGLFLAWTIFVLASSCAFCALSVGLRSLQLATYLVFVVLSGWIFNLIASNNFDNALALTVAPVLVGLIAHLDPNALRWRVLLAVVLAALFYIYPELGMVVAASGVFVGFYRWRRERTPLKPWCLTAATVMVVALLITLPFLPHMIHFIRHQTTVGLTAAARPGADLFPGLLSWRFHPSAFWGVAGELGVNHLFAGKLAVDRLLLISNIYSTVLTGAALVGIIRLFRTGHAGLATWLVMLVAMSFVMIVEFRYAYGAYKFIVLVWWAIGLAVMLGFQALSDFLRRFVHWRTAPAIYVVIIIASLGHALLRHAYSVATTAAPSMEHYRRLTTIEPLIGKGVVLAVVDDPTANQWATYYLRDMPHIVGVYRGYMAGAHIVPLMERSRTYRPGDISHVLTDARPATVLGDLHNWALAWSSGAYRLWTPRTQWWSILQEVSNLYGLESVAGRPFFWMGTGPTAVHVSTGRNGMLGLRAYFEIGPSLPAAREISVRVSTDSGHTRDVRVSNGVQVLRIPVKAGEDRVLLTVLEKDTKAVPGGDPRTLLLGVRDLSIELSDESDVANAADPAQRARSSNETRTRLN